MKKIIIALTVLIIVGAGTYYIVFRKKSGENPTNNKTQYQQPAPNPAPSTSNNSPSVPDNPQPAKKTEAAINISNFSFDPKTLTVKNGSKVTWTNNDAAPHNILSDPKGIINSPMLSQNQSFSFTFVETGSIDYYCGIHPAMKGKIIVED